METHTRSVLVPAPKSSDFRRVVVKRGGTLTLIRIDALEVAPIAAGAAFAEVLVIRKSDTSLVRSEKLRIVGTSDHGERCGQAVDGGLNEHPLPTDWQLFYPLAYFNPPRRSPRETWHPLES